MIAIDSNVFVYSMLSDNRDKRARAIELIGRHTDRDAVLLWQVACEVGSVIARLVDRKRLGADGFELVDAVWSRFPIQLPSPEMLRNGMRIHRQHQVSYWDAMLLGACVDAGVTRLYTEDLQSAPNIEGVEIINPFR
jgi:predicted nucleic acid-binding protein